MCALCDDGCSNCQRCGTWVCLECKHGDDLISPAYVTEGGDLMCRRCGIEYDAEDTSDEYSYDYLDGFGDEP